MPAMDRAFGDLNFALVKNTGTMRAILTYNSVPFIVEPGDIEPVPFEAIANWCGDPRSAQEPQTVRAQGGETRWIPSRYDERRRLKQLYGMSLEGGEDEIVDNGRWPHLLVKYQGHRVYTVLEDPYGEHLGMGKDAVMEQAQVDLKQHVQMLEDQLNVLKARYENPIHQDERDFVSFDEQEPPADVTPDPTVAPLPQTTPQFDAIPAWGMVSTADFDE